ncbi:hypothetical protein EA659_05780 [Pseudoxanthomonas winnipegensis]|nr:hypothetical protein EA659_05780 [Pseudoxanthomonas winnipegensis]
MNERSLEYLIIPELMHAFAPHCKSIVPIFFWKNREGGKISSAVHSNRQVRIIAVFARRPKLRDGFTIVEGKINHEITRFARKARSYGISTIAGFCAARSLFNLRAEAIHWISLMEEDPEKDILFFEETNTRKLLKYDGSSMSTFSTETVATRLLSEANKMPFNQGITLMSDLRHELSDYQFFMGGFGSSYKPVYLLIEQ